MRQSQFAENYLKQIKKEAYRKGRNSGIRYGKTVGRRECSDLREIAKSIPAYEDNDVFDSKEFKFALTTLLEMDNELPLTRDDIKLLVRRCKQAYVLAFDNEV